MSDLRTWDELARGTSCPFDAPRVESGEHWDRVSSLSVSTLYLHKVQTYRGYALLVFDERHATRLEQLTEAERLAFMADLYRAQLAVSLVVHPDHVNLELLGNAIPHLHWHIIPRYKDDPRWGQPIWMTTENEMPRHSLSDTERALLLEGLRNALAA